jgi:hypothetical protein
MPNSIDHLIYTAPSLTQGMDMMEALLGVRPAVGGQHPHWGTHNALLSLGNVYLEVLAPDSSLIIPKRGVWMTKYFEQGPQLSTWVLNTSNILELHHRAISSGISLGNIENGQREKPDGSLLQWQLTDPYALPHEGALPFLIDWGENQHPAESAPAAGQLVSLHIAHPAAKTISKKLKTLEIDLEVEPAKQFHLSAVIKTINGLITLS